MVVTAGQEPNCQVAGASMASTAVEELLLTQEEADTRLLLHARHAAVSGYEAVLIRTPDTNVAIIACSVSHVMPCTLLVEVGAGNNRRTVNMTAIAEKLSADVCNALPGLHAFTGSRSTSAFAFRGKSAAFNIVRGGRQYKHPSYLDIALEWKKIHHEFSNSLQSISG